MEMANTVKDAKGLLSELMSLFTPKYFMRIIFCAVFIVLILLIFKLIVSQFKKQASKRDMDPSLIKFFVRVIRILEIIIIVMRIFSLLNISGAGVIAALSAAAAALALALKDNLSDITGGIVILFTKPFVTGDFIVFGDHKGYVEKIDMMHTYIRTYDDTHVVIPNSIITKSEVDNYTKNPEIRVQIFVPVSYEADIDKVKEILLKICRSIDHVIDNEKFFPKVMLEEFGESSVNMVVRVWTPFEFYWTVYYAIMDGIKKEFEHHNIVIPYNQLDVHLDKIEN